jgi:hypothetical protein
MSATVANSNHWTLQACNWPIPACAIEAEQAAAEDGGDPLAALR